MPSPRATPEPFRPLVPPAVLADLRARLRATRWPDSPEGSGWSLGSDVDHLRDLVDHWADRLERGAQTPTEDRLPRYTCKLGGLDIRFVHVPAAVTPGSHGPALPLVLTHGWPDSSWRYSKVIPLLTDPVAHGAHPGDAFDLVVPDMPGFGWSERPVHAIPDAVSVADLWAELMTVLGYPRFGAVGGDIGSSVSRFLALDHPDRVVAVHRMDAGLPVFSGDRGDLTGEERDWLDAAASWGAQEGAYAALHRTKPQTAAVGLNDSPAGLAAWVVEKLRSWSDCGGEIERSFTEDEILSLLTTYWVTGTIGSSMRMYRANAAIPAAQHARRIEVPSGFALFPADIVRPPRAWLERTANTVWVSEPPRGGHFAPFEEPELYARDLRDFFRPYRAAVLDRG